LVDGRAEGRAPDESRRLGRQQPRRRDIGLDLRDRQ
jgi:hypothetical protein